MSSSLSCFHDQIFFDPDRNVTGRGHHNVKAVAAGFDFRQGGVVGIVIGDRHLNLVFGFELFDQVRIGVVA